MQVTLIYAAVFTNMLLISLVLVLIQTNHRKTLKYIYKQLDRLDDGESPTPPTQRDVKIIQSEKKGRAYNPSRDIDRTMRGEQDELFIE